MLKVYRSKTGVKYSLLFQKEDKTQVQIEFRGSNKEYRTRDKELQGLLEGGRHFAEKKIELFQSVTEDEKSKDTAVSEITITSVTEIQDAAAFLQKEYQVKGKDLKTPADIKAAAKAKGVSFPNVVFN
ncbi:MAG: hypothetical protein LBL07_05725 [Tannerella sp.]|jgi:hypothetical protein|nr:hypothetical protein [Tannerella sp.]